MSEEDAGLTSAGIGPARDLHLQSQYLHKDSNAFADGQAASLLPQMIAKRAIQLVHRTA